MTKYEKPVLEVIELRPEERLANAYTLSNNNDKYEFTIFDEDLSDDNFDFFKYRKIGANEKYAAMTFATKSAVRDFLKFLGF